MDKLIITPKTRIYELLEAYPQLEDTLIQSAPQFKKLTNPVLRRTITKITNLGQASTIAGINVEELVNKLRKEAGQVETASFENEETNYVTLQPDWFNSMAIEKTIDIRDMLHQGEQPVHEVLSSIKKLGESKILEIIAPFLPAPLIDKSLSLGYQHWVNELGPEEIRIYFYKPT